MHCYYKSIGQGLQEKSLFISRGLNIGAIGAFDFGVEEDKDRAGHVDMHIVGTAITTLVPTDHDTQPLWGPDQTAYLEHLLQIFFRGIFLVLGCALGNRDWDFAVPLNDCTHLRVTVNRGT